MSNDTISSYLIAISLSLYTKVGGFQHFELHLGAASIERGGSPSITPQIAESQSSEMFKRNVYSHNDWYVEDF